MWLIYFFALLLQPASGLDFEAFKNDVQPLEWQVMQRAWPGRFSVSSGCTVALKASKSSPGAGWKNRAKK